MLMRWTKIVIGIIIGVSVGFVLVWGVQNFFIQRQQLVSIDKYLKDGQSATWVLKAQVFQVLKIRSWQLRVRLNSTYGDMNVKITVDGKIACEKSNVYEVDYRQNIEPNSHIIHITVENPTTFGLGPTILVTGVARISCSP